MDQLSLSARLIVLVGGAPIETPGGRSGPKLKVMLSPSSLSVSSVAPTVIATKSSSGPKDIVSGTPE